MGHGQHVTLSIYHGDTHLNDQNVHLVDTGAYMTRVHAMLASPSYNVCSNPYHAGTPALATLRSGLYYIIIHNHI